MRSSFSTHRVLDAVVASGVSFLNAAVFELGGTNSEDPGRRCRVERDSFECEAVITLEVCAVDARCSNEGDARKTKLETREELRQKERSQMILWLSRIWNNLQT